MDYNRIKLKDNEGKLVEKLYENDKIIKCKWTPDGIEVIVNTDDHQYKDITCKEITVY